MKNPIKRCGVGKLSHMRTQGEHEEKPGMLDTKYKDKPVLRERDTDRIHKGWDDNRTGEVF